MLREVDVELGAEFPAVLGVLPHGGVGAGVDGFVVGICGDPVALFGGEGVVGGDLDGVGDALVGEGGFGGVEALLEEVEVGGARGDEGAVADDADVVVAEGVSDAKQIASRNGAIGVVAGAEDLRFIRLFVQGCILRVVSSFGRLKSCTSVFTRSFWRLGGNRLVLVSSAMPCRLAQNSSVRTSGVGLWS